MKASKTTMLSINAAISKATGEYLTIQNIRDIVSEETGISIMLMGTKTRKEEVVFARQLFYYLSRALVKPQPGYAVVASFFNQDHATALHGIKTINNLIETNKAVRNRIADIYKKCQYSMTTKHISVLTDKEFIIWAIKEELLTWLEFDSKWYTLHHGIFDDLDKLYSFWIEHIHNK